MKLNQAIAKRLKTCLKEKGMTQYALSMKTGVPQSTISTIINGKVESVLVSSIYQLCIGLEIELTDFFNDKILFIENIED